MFEIPQKPRYNREKDAEENEMDLLERFAQETVTSFQKACTVREVPADAYSRMRYPKLLPMMRFAVDRYEVEGFGHLMLMQTRAMGGLMRLVTASFTPSCGGAVPYLLIDMMAMQKKRTVFVEYYDCTRDGVTAPALDALVKTYADVPAYAEKPAWYVGERMPCSLIKGTADGSEERLSAMVRDSVAAYLELIRTAPKDPANLTGLRAFQDRMVNEGNPSSATMEKLLGKAGAETFFRKVVMPVE